MGGLARKARLLRYLLRYLGPGWILFRVAYALKTRLGFFARAAPAPRRPGELAGYAWGLPAAGDGRARPGAVARADRNLAGEFLFFSHEWRDLGPVPDWCRHPETGVRWPATHWSRIADFGGGDIKQLWEPGRFAFAFDLARAYLATGDARYPARFWELFGSFRASNPPGFGVHWRCGQEVALRSFALAFAAAAFRGDPASTTARRAALADFLAAGAARIEVNLAYALSQKNNHGTSEAAGLLLAGLLLPDHPDAGRWRESGRRHLDAQLVELFDEAGVFSQYSLNYQRVALHTVLFVAGPMRAAGLEFGPEARARLRAACRFLRALVDPETGGVPRVGNDDGARILVLSEAGYEDFRPLLDGLARLVGADPLPRGDYSELGDLLGLPPGEAPAGGSGGAAAGGRESGGSGDGSGDDPGGGPPPPAARGPVRWGGNLVSWHLPGFRAFLRLGESRFRASQADMLHLDLWAGGRNILRDTGTYSYNAAPPWDDLFAGSWAHNAPGYEGLEPLERFSPFLRFPWPDVALRVHDPAAGDPAGLRGVTASHDCFRRRGRGDPVTRTVLIWEDSALLVIDRGGAPAGSRLRACWHSGVPVAVDPGGAGGTLGGAAPWYFAAAAETAPEIEYAEGGERPEQGWYSPRYKRRQPGPRFEVRAAPGQGWLATAFAPFPVSLAVSGGRLVLSAGARRLEVDPLAGADERPV